MAGWLSLPPLVAAGVIAVFDFLVASPLFTEPSAFDFYSRWFENKDEQGSIQSIRKDLLGFYIRHGWFWFLTTLTAMYISSPILSFGFINVGILYWNVSFELELWNTSDHELAWLESSTHWKWLAPLARCLQQFFDRPWLATYLRHGRYAVYVLATVQQMHRMHMGLVIPGIFVAAAGIIRWVWWANSRPRTVHRPFFEEPFPEYQTARSASAA